MATLALRELAKTYGGDVDAVKAMSLAVDEGKLLALLGPSGCGKTSTCKMIAGLESITSGDLLFDSERVNDLEPERRNVAMVFEDYALYPRMNVFDNVAFPLQGARRPPRGDPLAGRADAREARAHPRRAAHASPSSAAASSSGSRSPARWSASLRC